jgi:hypothetical protein
MKEGRRHVLIAGAILVLVAGGMIALLASRGGNEEPTGDAAVTEAGSARAAASAAAARTGGPIRFLLSDRYTVGTTIDVVIENVGTRAYAFQLFYQACFLSYFDSSGRRFIIPPGTHCDILAEGTIRPGERRMLFRWRLNECVKDQWGCARSRLLPPGTYTIKGRFKPKAGGPPTRAEKTFRIIVTS